MLEKFDLGPRKGRMVVLHRTNRYQLESDREDQVEVEMGKGEVEEDVPDHWYLLQNPS